MEQEHFDPDPLDGLTADDPLRRVVTFLDGLTVDAGSETRERMLDAYDAIRDTARLLARRDTMPSPTPPAPDRSESVRFEHQAAAVYKGAEPWNVSAPVLHVQGDPAPETAKALHEIARANYPRPDHAPDRGETDDIVMAIKVRWARALDLEDETMAVVALEKATRRQREAMENAMAADIKHAEAYLQERRRADEAEARARQAEQERDEALAHLEQANADFEAMVQQRNAARQAGYEECAAKVRASLDAHESGRWMETVLRVGRAVGRLGPAPGGPAPTPKGPTEAAPRGGTPMSACSECDDGIQHTAHGPMACGTCGGGPEPRAPEPPAAPLEPERAEEMRLYVDSESPDIERVRRNTRALVRQLDAMTRRARSAEARLAAPAAAPQGAGPVGDPERDPLTPPRGIKATGARWERALAAGRRVFKGQTDAQEAIDYIEQLMLGHEPPKPAAPSAPQGGPDDGRCRNYHKGYRCVHSEHPNAGKHFAWHDGKPLKWDDADGMTIDAASPPQGERPSAYETMRRSFEQGSDAGEVHRAKCQLHALVVDVLRPTSDDGGPTHG